MQELVDITPDTSLKITVARWVLAGGKFISHDGITPDIEVPEESGEEDRTRDDEADGQESASSTDLILDRAVEFLLTGE